MAEKLLTIDAKRARIIYTQAPDILRQWLEEEFGKDHFSLSIFDRFQSWEAVAEEVGVHPVNDLPFPNAKNDREHATNGYWQWDWISEVFNGNKYMDWTDGDQPKYGPVIYNYHLGSGWSFGASGYDWTTTSAYGGARLRFLDKKHSDHFATYFMDIINKMNKPRLKL